MAQNIQHTTYPDFIMHCTCTDTLLGFKGCSAVQVNVSLEPKKSVQAMHADAIVHKFGNNTSCRKMFVGGR